MEPIFDKACQEAVKCLRFATRLILELRGISYKERLNNRRTWRDLITTYKILRGTDRADWDRLLKRWKQEHEGGAGS